MKHLFVPHPIALLAKEKGFNEPCLAFYIDFDGDLIPCLQDPKCDPLLPSLSMTENFKLHPGATAAPIYSQLLDWFRETHNLFIKIERAGVGDMKYEYCWSISNLDQAPNRNVIVSGLDTPHTYKTYHESLNKAIDEAFKLI